MLILLVVSVGLISSNQVGGQISHQQDDQKCVASQEPSAYNSVSCDFEERRFCGWNSVQNDEYGLKWRRGSHLENYYATLSVDDKRARDKGRLASSWLEPKPGFKCRLNFGYSIKESNCCRLSVLQKIGINGTETSLWSTEETSAFSKTISVPVNCTEGCYQLYFDGERTSPGPFPSRRSGTFVRIDIDDIVYHVEELPRTPTSTTPSVSTTVSATVSTTVSATVSTLPMSDQSGTKTPSPTTTFPTEFASSKGLDSGALAGIVVAVVIGIVALSVIAVIVYRRRRTSNGGETDSWLIRKFKQKKSPSSETNATYESEEGRTARTPTVTAHVENTADEPRVHPCTVDSGAGSGYTECHPSTGLELATLVNPSTTDAKQNREQSGSSSHDYVNQVNLKDAEGCVLGRDLRGEYDHINLKRCSDHTYDRAHFQARDTASSVQNSHDNNDHTQAQRSSSKSRKAVSSAQNTDETYDHTQAQRSSSKSLKADSSAQDTDDTYDHTQAQRSSSKSRKPVFSAQDTDDTYDHTQAPRSSSKSLKAVPLAQDTDDTYDHTQAQRSSSKSLKPVSSAQDTNDTYDHTQATQRGPNPTSGRDVYSVSKSEEEEKLSALFKTKDPLNTAPSPNPKLNLQARQANHTASQKKHAYENIPDDRPLKSTDPKLAQPKASNDFSLVKNIHQDPSSEEAAAAYASAETTIYEVIDDDGQLKPTGYVPSDDVYYELEINGESTGAVGEG